MVLWVSPPVLLFNTMKPALFFRIWHSFEFALSMIAEIRQYGCIHSLCSVGLSWCFEIQFMYLLYTSNACHKIIVGLQIKVWIRVLLNSLDVVKLFLDIGKLGPRFFWKSEGCNRKSLHSRIYTLSLVLSMPFRARHSCANRLLCSTTLFACLRSILHVGLWCVAICQCGTCLVVCAKGLFAWLRSLFSPNACLFDC